DHHTRVEAVHVDGVRELGGDLVAMHPHDEALVRRGVLLDPYVVRAAPFADDHVGAGQHAARVRDVGGGAEVLPLVEFDRGAAGVAEVAGQLVDEVSLWPRTPMCSGAPSRVRPVSSSRRTSTLVASGSLWRRRRGSSPRSRSRAPPLVLSRKSQRVPPY